MDRRPRLFLTVSVIDADIGITKSYFLVHGLIPTRGMRTFPSTPKGKAMSSRDYDGMRGYPPTREIPDPEVLPDTYPENISVPKGVDKNRGEAVHGVALLACA